MQQVLPDPLRTGAPRGHQLVDMKVAAPDQILLELVSRTSNDAMAGPSRYKPIAALL